MKLLLILFSLTGFSSVQAKECLKNNENICVGDTVIYYGGRGKVEQILEGKNYSTIYMARQLNNGDTESMGLKASWAAATKGCTTRPSDGKKFCVGDTLISDATNSTGMSKIMGIYGNGEVVMQADERYARINRRSSDLDYMASTKGCTTPGPSNSKYGKRFCVGDAVLDDDLNPTAWPKIVGIYGSEYVSIQYPSKETRSKWLVSSVVGVKGCTTRLLDKKKFCVGDTVSLLDEEGNKGSGKIVGIYENGDVVIQVNGERARWPLHKIAHTGKGKLKGTVKKFVCFLGFNCPKREDDAKISGQNRWNIKEGETHREEPSTRDGSLILQ